jgi:hypothetical protein
MQPNMRTNKTLLASALILGLGNAFHASSESFDVTAGAIPDVTLTANSTLTIAATELSFGTSVKLTPTAGSTCTITGAGEATEADVDYSIDGDATNTDIVSGATTGGLSIGDIQGSGCIADTAGAQSGSVMVIDIDGADTSTVSVSIPDVVGTGWTYSPGAETCLSDFDRAATADTCTTFSGINTLTGIQMSAGENTETGAVLSTLGDIEGQARLLLAGTLTFDGTAVTAPAGEVVTVTITYE